MIDRVAPSQQPQRKPIGYQNWRSLLFLHWPVPVDVMRKLVPSSLELDQYDGKSYIGIVPFEMKDIRLYGIPRGFGLNFLETNVRTYVIANDQPGVYFFSLEASSRLAVWAARAGWGLPYHFAKMRMTNDGHKYDYLSCRTNGQIRHHVRCEVRSELGELTLGSLEHFFLERYFLFVERRQRLYVGQVYHKPYPVHAAKVLDIQDDLIASNELSTTSQLPEFAHFSPGVNVKVFALQKLP